MMHTSPALYFMIFFMLITVAAKPAAAQLCDGKPVGILSSKMSRTAALIDQVYYRKLLNEQLAPTLDAAKTVYHVYYEKLRRKAALQNGVRNGVRLGVPPDVAIDLAKKEKDVGKIIEVNYKKTTALCFYTLIGRVFDAYGAHFSEDQIEALKTIRESAPRDPWRVQDGFLDGKTDDAEILAGFKALLPAHQAALDDVLAAMKKDFRKNACTDIKNYQGPVSEQTIGAEKSVNDISVGVGKIVPVYAPCEIPEDEKK